MSKCIRKQPVFSRFKRDRSTRTLFKIILENSSIPKSSEIIQIYSFENSKSYYIETKRELDTGESLIQPNSRAQIVNALKFKKLKSKEWCVKLTTFRRQKICNRKVRHHSTPQKH